MELLKIEGILIILTIVFGINAIYMYLIKQYELANIIFLFSDIILLVALIFPLLN